MGRLAIAQSDIGHHELVGGLEPVAAHRGPTALGHDGFQDPQAVGNGVQVALPVDATPLDTGHLGHRQAGKGDAAVDHGFDLEAVAPHHRRGPAGMRLRARQVEQAQDVAPEGVVAVAQVAVARLRHAIGQHVETQVARAAHPGDVGAATAGEEAAAFGEVRAARQCLQEQRDLRRIGRPVGVEHDNDVTGGSSETARQRIALARARLPDHLDIRQHRLGRFDRAIDRVTVYQNDFVHCRKVR